MKKKLLVFIFVFVFLIQFVASSYAAGNAPNQPTVGTTTGNQPISIGTAGVPPDGTWLTDDEVTFTGKNAARAKDLFNWVLVHYQWSTDDNTLISFWAK